MSTFLIVVCIAVAVLAVFIYIIGIQVRKCRELEGIVNTLLTNMQTLSDYIEEASERLNSSSLKAAFDNDDETGIFFKEIREIQSNLDLFRLGRSNGSKEISEQ